MPFKKGQSGNPKGGSNKGSGRPPNWFKMLCRDQLAANKYRGLKIVGEISRGDAEFEKVFNNNGSILKAKVGPSAAEIIHANEFLRDSAGYKPVQEIEHSGSLLEDLIVKSKELE